jgi:magnesium-protoporphyrin O-methyltransferase
VFIHYPQQPAEEMVKHLCSLTEERLIVSLAPYTP